MEERTAQDMRAREEAHRELLQSELSRMVDELREIGATRLIVFGSTASGKTNLFSDLDIIVVMPSDEPFVERSASLYQTLNPKVDADILAYTPEEFSKMEEDSLFIQTALADGKELL